MPKQPKELADILPEDEANPTSEPLMDYLNVPLQINSYELAHGGYGEFYVMNCTVLSDGSEHFIRTGAKPIVRALLKTPRGSFPVLAMFEERGQTYVAVKSS